jgi:aryl-alcohol dehydrogenase-like predicted oxidoreductase
MAGDSEYLRSVLGRTGMPVFRLGLSASYRPGVETVHRALDEGINFFFAYGFDRHMVRALRERMKTDREKIVLATGAYNYIFSHSNLRRSTERRLRQFRTDYLDVLMFLGVMKPKEFPSRVLDAMVKLKEEGKARAIGISTHNRKFAGELARTGVLDVLMIRYNAAHRGAETDIFPHVGGGNPGIVSYTATRWTRLLTRPKGWPAVEALPTAGMTYRFALNNPDVNVVLTAPRNMVQLQENLAEIRKGPLSEEEMAFMRKFGDVVHDRKEWFM